MSELEAKLEAIVALYAVDAPLNRDALELDSLDVVLIHDAIEEAFGIRLRARDVTPDAFATIANLTRVVERAIGSGP